MLNTADMISMHREELYNHKKSLSLKAAKLLLLMYFPKAKISAKIYCLSSTEVKFHLEDHIKGPSRWPGSTLAQQNSYPGLHPPHHRTCVAQMSRENAFSADLLMWVIQARNNWVTRCLYCPVNTALHLLTSLPASLLAQLLVPVVEDAAQNNPSCHTCTQTHTLLLMASVFSGGCCCSGWCPFPGLAIGPAPANLYVCAESCWEDGVSLLRGWGVPAERVGCPCRSQRPPQRCLHF